MLWGSLTSVSADFECHRCKTCRYRTQGLQHCIDCIYYDDNVAYQTEEERTRFGLRDNYEEKNG